jgi:hypothetical protein
MRKLELFIAPKGAKGEAARRIWTAISPDVGRDGAVTGTVVADVAAWQQQGKPVMLLALANSYYHGVRIVRIDATADLPPIPAAHKQQPDGAWAPPGQDGLSKSTLDQSILPRELYTGITGTRRIELHMSDGGLSVRMEQVGEQPATFTFDPAAKTWQRSP